MSVTVRALELADAEACDAIILTLPYHFAIEEGRVECAHAVRSQPGFVAEDDGSVVGFLTFERRFTAAAEITWLAVRSDRRHGGIGGALVDRFADAMRAEGRRLLLVLTVSPNDEPDTIPDGYQATRAFYETNGFVLARDLPEFRWSDLIVLLVRTLDER